MKVVQKENPEIDRLENFPVTFFAVVMGMLGLTLASHAAETAFGASSMVSIVVLAVSIVIMIVISALYAAKAFARRGAVSEEWAHPVKIAFFPTISISVLLLATALLPHHRELAMVLWVVGAVGQGALTLSVVANWIGHRTFQTIHIGPAWFIPAVGNVVVPVAGAALGFTEISWLFFSAGLVFWIILLTLVMNRLIFHDPLPARLLPTLVILIAPPAVAFVAYMRLTSDMDAFARILLNSGYVFAAVVLTQSGKFARLPFALSWWALSFPVAALTIASFSYAHETGSVAHQFVAGLLMAALVAIVAVLLYRTGRAIAARKICLPE